MRTACLLFLAVPALWALDNSVTIYDSSGSTQTNRPVTISRVFLEGEMATCPQAYDGATPLTTQADIRTTWADGSAKHALVTFKTTITGNGSKTINFRASGSACVNTGYMSLSAISAASWDGQVETVANNITHIFNAKMMLSALGAISTDTNSIQARYTMRGALATQVVIEDGDPATRQFCKGYEWDKPANNWKTASTNSFKSLCPIFVVTIYPDTPTSGLNAVRVEAVLENNWSDRSQTQIYNPTVKTGAALSTYTGMTGWRHIPKTDWRVDTWSTNQPGDIQVDYNFPYLTAAKVIPQYNMDLAASFSALNAELTTYWNTRVTNGSPVVVPAWPATAASQAYLWNTAVANSGGRKDMGIMNHVMLSYLYLMGNTSVSVANRKLMFDRFIVGLSEAAGGLPYQYREPLSDRCFYRADGDASGKFSASGSCTANAKGRPWSIDARPTAYAFGSTGVNGFNGSAVSEEAWTTGRASGESLTQVCPYVTVTATSGDPTLASTAHGYPNGTVVRMRGGPSGINSETVPYYVVNTAADTFQLASTLGGTALIPTASSTTSRVYPAACHKPISGSGNQFSNWWHWEDNTSWGHWYETEATAYALTGDWYFLRRLQYNAAYVLMRGSPVAVSTSNSNARDGTNGLIFGHNSSRVSAWLPRTLADGAYWSPTGSVEALYFEQKLKNNTAAREGLLDITTGDGGLYQSDATRGPLWTKGRTIWARSATMPHPVHDVRQATCTPEINEGLVEDTCLGGTGFMENYIHIAWGRIAEQFGFTLPVAQELARGSSLEATFSDGNYNPYMSGEYHFPVATTPGALNTPITAFATLSQRGAKIIKTCSLAADINSSVTTFTCTVDAWWNQRSGQLYLIDSEYFRASIGTIPSNQTGGGLCVANPCTVTFSGVTRGLRGSSATSHTAGASITKVHDEWEGLPNGTALGSAGIADHVHGYPHILMSALSFEYLRGDSMPGWQAHMTRWPALADAPLINSQGWALRPRPRIDSLSVSAGATAANISYTVPLSESCGTIKVSTSPILGGDSSDASDSTVSGSGSCLYSATSLLTGTLHYYRITAGKWKTVRKHGTFTTTGAGQPLSIITTSPLPGGTQTIAYSQMIQITGGTGPFTYSVSAGSLPAGLSLNTSSGAITGTPSAAGTSNFTIRVVDSAAGDQSRAFAIPVASAVTITTTTLPATTIGATYSQQLALTGGTAPFTWSLDSGALPVGTALSASGLISGITTTAQTANFVARVTDAVGTTSAQALSVTVVAPQAMTLSWLSSTTYLTYQTAFSETLTRVGGTAAFTYTLLAGSWPAGIGLNSATGEVSGTPTEIGVFPVTVRVTDGGALVANASTTMVVQAAPGNPELDIGIRPSANSAIIRVRLPGVAAATTATIVVTDASDTIVYQTTLPAGLATRRAVASGLSPGTVYRVDATFGAGASRSATFATLSTAITGAAVPVSVAKSTITGTTHVRARYGGTEALGNTSSVVACGATVCTVSLTRDDGPLWVAIDRCSDGACSTVLAAPAPVLHLVR